MKRFHTHVLLLIVAFMVAGCVAVAPEGKKFSTDNETGLVVLSFVDRALFTPFGGAVALAGESGNKQWVIFTGRGDATLAPTNGKGAIYYRAAELAPGKYTISNWRLHNSSGGESTAVLKTPLEFDVVKGKAIYLGSFNVLRFAENAQFRDNFAVDQPNIAKYLPHLAKIPLENKSFASEWWPLPGATDMETLGAPTPGTAK